MGRLKKLTGEELSCIKYFFDYLEHGRNLDKLKMNLTLLKKRSKGKFNLVFDGHETTLDNLIAHLELPEVYQGHINVCDSLRKSIIVDGFFEIN